jgi:4-amino-4-deoxy-L-arabinose transferase-like glycosyltransferase
MMTSWIEARRSSIAISVLLIGAALVLRAFSFTTAGLDWDESLYIVIAQRWLAGGVPYVTVWDQHPMGLPAVFAAATWLVGDGLLAARIAGFVAVVGTAILLWRMLFRFAGEALAGVLAAVIYLFYMTRPEGLAANTEVFNNLIVSVASFLLFGEMTRHGTRVRTGVILIASLLFGIGLQIKYVVLPEAAALCCMVLVKAWRDGEGFGRLAWLAIVSMAGGLLPTVLMSLYFWKMGAWQDYLDGNLSANVNYLGDRIAATLVWLRLRYGLVPLLGLLPWPFALAWLYRDRAIRSRYGELMVWLAVWLIAACIDVAIPFKFWKHYFNALIPPLCLMAGMGAVLLTRYAWPRRRLFGFMVVATLLPAVFSLIKHAPDSRSVDRLNVPRAIADRIRNGGTDGRDVYVFNYDSLVYACSDTVPPTKYVLGIELADFSGISGSRPEIEIDRILSARPRWMVVADPSPYIYPPAIWERLNAALRQYEVVAEYQEMDYIQPPITVRLYRSTEPARADAGTVQRADMR